MKTALKILAVSISLSTLGFLIWQAQKKPEAITKKNNLSRHGLSIQAYFQDPGSGAFPQHLSAAAGAPEAVYFSSSKAPATIDGLKSIEDSGGAVPEPAFLSSSKSASPARTEGSGAASPVGDVFWLTAAPPPVPIPLRPQPRQEQGRPNFFPSSKIRVPDRPEKP